MKKIQYSTFDAISLRNRSAVSSSPTIIQWVLFPCLFSITDKSQTVPFGRYLHKFYAFPIRGSNLRLLSNRRLLYEWRRPSLTTAAAEDGIMGWRRRWSLLKVQFGDRYCQFPFVWHTQYFCTPSGPMSGKHSSAVVWRYARVTQ